MQKDNSIEQMIGKRIQKIRQARGYTQQQFSEMVGLSRIISLMLSEERVPSD